MANLAVAFDPARKGPDRRIQPGLIMRFEVGDLPVKIHAVGVQDASIPGATPVVGCRLSTSSGGSVRRDCGGGGR